MQEQNDQVRRSGGGSWFRGFIVGGLIGAGIALLTARRTGEETRQILADKGQIAMDKAMDYKDQALDAADTARVKVMDAADTARVKAKDIASGVGDRATQVAQQVRSKATDITDKAREKIGQTAGDMQGQIPSTGGVDQISGGWTEEASRDPMVSDKEARREKKILEDDIDKTYDL